MDDKIYTPPIIKEVPFPNEIASQIISNQSGSNGVFTPLTTQEVAFPDKRVAKETINNVFNTKTKKILGELQFTEHGAIQIGKYTEGLNGDIRLSPNGIVARDKAGNTTFLLDGDTGDAAFRGQVLAEDFIVSDSQGLRSIANFENQSTSTGILTSTDSSSYVDITNPLITSNLQRAARFIAFGTFSFYTQVTTSGSYNGIVEMSLIIDNAVASTVYHNVNYNATTGDASGIGRHSITCFEMNSLKTGIHEFKLQCKVTSGSNMTIYYFGCDLAYMILGR